jgi:hypothetical protein
MKSMEVPKVINDIWFRDLDYLVYFTTYLNRLNLRGENQLVH